MSKKIHAIIEARMSSERLPGKVMLKIQNKYILDILIDRVKKFEQIIQREADPNKMNPRYIFIHTFAHLLINTLIHECGYGAAALQERIYSSNSEKNPMAGILIYTSSGNKEATMGGLVRMGKPGYLERVIEKCIKNSEWCSVDPVCMEVGEMGGQGPYSSNLAACHNCCLVPETSCEFFNSYLDRGLVTGNLKQDNLNTPTLIDNSNDTEDEDDDEIRI